MEKRKVEQMNFGSAPLNATVGRCRAELSISQVVGHVVLWLLITVVTAGIGLIFFPYAAAGLILNSIVITDEFNRPTARLRCDISFTEQLGHGLIWALLVVFTGGFMAPFYVFALAHFVISRIELIST